MAQTQVGWQDLQGQRCLFFTFPVHLSGAEATFAVQLWEEALDEVGHPVIHVWNATVMKGYDKEARILWQQIMKKRKTQITLIWLVTESSFVRSGASFMSVLLGLDIKTAKNLEEIRL